MSLHAAPHALDAAFDVKKSYAIDILAKKEPLKYYFEDCSSPYAAEIANSYRKWFGNVARYSYRKEQPDLKDYKEIIDFAASKEAYVCTDEKSADILFYIKDAAQYLGYGPRGSGGVFKHENGKMLIAIRKDQIDERYFTTLVHEIGHSLRMEDLYEGQFYNSSGGYGSGVKDSVMNHSDSLTCDDADAILNALYLVKKLAGQNPEDFKFASFCDSNLIYKNARVLNRPPLVINYQGSRTVYTYCKDGKPHDIIKINPFNYDGLYEQIQAPADCEYTPLAEVPPAPKTASSYIIADFATGKTLSLKNNGLSRGMNAFMALPGSGGLTLQISTDGKIPGFIKITDETQKDIYFMLYLQEGYNIVYSAYINGKNSGRTDGTLLIYDRKNPSKSYVYYPENRGEGLDCESSPEQCAEMKNLLNKTLASFKDDFNFDMPFFGGAINHGREWYIKKAQTWERYLLEKFPPMSVINERVKNELNFKPALPQPGELKIKFPAK